jgi:Transposase domain (DUF772)
MMTALLLYAYCNGVYSSRRIVKASRERVDFMSVAQPGGRIRRLALIIYYIYGFNILFVKS